MTVEELVQELQQFDPSAEIFAKVTFHQGVHYRRELKGIEADTDAPDYYVFVVV